MKNKILIVDDEPALLSALVDKFTRKGFNVETAENGKTGLKTALKTKPNLILLDIIMPVMDGISMLYKLRDNAWGKKVKVILLTNLSDPETAKSKSFTKKIDGYLVKSNCKINEIVRQVNKNLKGGICRES